MIPVVEPACVTPWLGYSRATARGAAPSLATISRDDAQIVHLA
ncbi:MAG: hypothetical protein ABSD78_14050 [Acidimicrobiales bacterium]